MENIAFIDNIKHAFNEGQSVLSFVKKIEGDKIIPTLCDAPNLEAFGACRVCSVDVALEQNGKTKTMASCHTPITKGMYIYPSSESIQKLRKNIIELVLTDHPLDCLTCEVNGNCELKEYFN